MAKVIAVLGATGAQGGGLVRAILADPSTERSLEEWAAWAATSATFGRR